MKRNIKLGLSLIAAAVAINAQALEVGGSVVSTATVNNVDSNLSATALPTKKTVYLMKVKLTEQELKRLQSYNPKQLSLATSHSNLPSKVQLGMNNVPVLDQGRHGTCVTFANTAAVDAVLGHGDLLSQLCTLELSSYLAQNGYFEHGWDGTWGSNVLNLLMQFGYITKDDQKTKSCNGVKEYPVRDQYSHGLPMKVEDYKKMSNNVLAKVSWQSLMSVDQRFDDDTVTPYDAEKLLNQVKSALALEVEKHIPSRVTFGVLLPIAYCDAGACGRFHQPNDTWALTASIERDTSHAYGGHEMIITGYDDDAVATDNEGKQHKGLLTLRNSWGNDAGDHGDYYMSYDFFKKFILEVQQIKPAVDNR